MSSTRTTRRSDDPGRLDLHLHTSLSDGKHPPDEVLRRLARGRLDFVAITDHDLPNPIPAGEHTLEGHTLRVLAAVELSGAHEGREQHLLVYFRGDMPPAFRAFLVERACARAERYDQAIAALGLPDLPRADLAARAGLRALTRYHLFAEMKARGHVKDSHEAWARLAGTVPLIDLPFLDAIRHARAAGGVCSWAHPRLEDAQRLVDVFVKAGLQGLEGIRPALPRRTRNGLATLAKKHDLVLTGGSDWHGWGGPDPGLFAVCGERARQFLDRLERDAA